MNVAKQAPAPGMVWDALRTVWRKAGSDRVTMLAAGLAYYGILGLLPALAAATALWGQVGNVGAFQKILSGTADRLAAFIMAGYCAVTAVLFKRFWEPGDFWSSGESKGRELFWDFLKNFSLASGFLLIVIGLDGHA